MTFGPLQQITAFADPSIMLGSELRERVDALISRRNGLPLVGLQEFGPLTGDVTAILQAALTATAGKAVLWVPPGRYPISPVDLPSGTHIECATMARTLTGGVPVTEFYYNGLNPKGRVALFNCVEADGVTLSNNILTRQVALDGVNQAVANGLDGFLPPRRLWDDIGSQFRRFRAGMGDYAENCHLIGTKAHSCLIGFAKGFIDSRLILLHAINNSQIGFQQLKGANDAQFVCFKADYNGVGVSLGAGSSNISMTGGAIDRNSTRGISITGSNNFTISTTMFRRNGRTDPGAGSDDARRSANCHLYVDSGTVDGETFTPRGVITGITTRTGADDDGSGFVGALASIVLGNIDRLMVTGDDMGAVEVGLHLLAGKTRTKLLKQLMSEVA